MMIRGTSQTITIQYRCPFCRTDKTEDYPTEGFSKWYLEGANIQEAFPNLSATKREILISHICPDCQEKIFK